MSPTPSKDEDVEQGGQSTDGQEDNIMADAEAQAQALGYDLEVKEQDRWLPIANVARIMKTALPDNAKIAKEAKECMQECVSEFISFITSEASEKCQQEKRKTVNGEDILFAMTSLGFENYAEALKIYLSKYRETQSARGENQNRPSSGGGFGPGGPVGGSSSTTDAPSNSDFQTSTHTSNNILSPSGGGSHDSGAYGSGYPPTIPGTHNGNGAESY